MSYTIHNYSCDTIFVQYKQTWPTDLITKLNSKTVEYHIDDGYQFEIWERSNNQDTSWGQLVIDNGANVYVYGRYRWDLNPQQEPKKPICPPD